MQDWPRVDLEFDPGPELDNIYPFDLEITCQAEPADLEDQGKHWEGIDYQISEAATDRSSQSGPDEVTGAD